MIQGFGGREKNMWPTKNGGNWTQFNTVSASAMKQKLMVTVKYFKFSNANLQT